MIFFFWLVFLAYFHRILSISLYISSLELKWPFYVKNYLNVYSNMGGVSTQVLSVDCLLQDHGIETKAIYIQTLLILILPFAIFFFSLVFLIFLYLKQKKTQKIRFIVILIVVSIFLQPTIIKGLFDSLSCEQIENFQFLKVNRLIECNSNSHIQWVFIKFMKNIEKIYCFFRLIMLFILSCSIGWWYTLHFAYFICFKTGKISTL